MIYEYCPDWMLQYIYDHTLLWVLGAAACYVALCAERAYLARKEEDDDL